MTASDAAAEDARAAADSPLQVVVLNGDLTFVRQPLVLGHYRSLKLTGTERVMDRLLGGAMEDGLRLRIYPDAPGSNRVFLNSGTNPYNPKHLPRPEAVIVVGLGEEGKLGGDDLVATIRQGILAWAHRNAERQGQASPTLDIATTLIGSGGTGISAGQSAQLIVRGVIEARQRLIEFNDRGEGGRVWPLVTRLSLIELYLDRATEAWRALRLQMAATSGEFVVGRSVRAGTGGLPRPLDPSYRGADYDFISALTHRSAAGEPSISYTLDTKRSRTEVRAQLLQPKLVRTIVTTASSETAAIPGIGKSLFNLLVPVEMRPFLGGTSDAVLEVDEGTASIPWELLEADRRDEKQEPWALRSNLLRKLRVTDPPQGAPDANADASVLVIGEPSTLPATYRELPSARGEARAVAECLLAQLGDEQVKRLIGTGDPKVKYPDAIAIVSTLLANSWRIVHISAHGEPPLMEAVVGGAAGEERCTDLRGVVLSDNVFLGPHEIKAMPAVPELVFVNCCHLAKSATGVLEASRDRPGFAAGVAAGLIGIGVRCVVAAGWAVDDKVAALFATTFYAALLAGDRFIDAVAKARRAAWNAGGNTWAAYQCYGDPDWRFQRGPSDAQRPEPRVAKDPYDGIASPVGLRLALETIAVRSRYQNVDPAEQTEALRQLAKRFGHRWRAQGEVAEAFGEAWGEVGNWREARRWYRRAVRAEEGASMKAIEQLANMRVRVAWASVAALSPDDLHGAPRGHGRKNSTRRKADASPRESATPAETVARARREIGKALALLRHAIAVQPTMERESLVGSAYKRLAMIEAVAGDVAAERQALLEMKRHYARAVVLGREAQPHGFFYPALNEIAADVVVNAGEPGWPGLSADLVQATRVCLEVRADRDPDFWSVLGLNELRLYEALASGRLADALPGLAREYTELNQRVNAPRNWATVYDTACFVLPRYGARAPSGEQEAATSLLASFRAFVQPAATP